jgi:hypothetical protein
MDERPGNRPLGEQTIAEHVGIPVRASEQVLPQIGILVTTGLGNLSVTSLISWPNPPAKTENRAYQGLVLAPDIPDGVPVL